MIRVRMQLKIAAFPGRKEVKRYPDIFIHIIVLNATAIIIQRKNQIPLNQKVLIIKNVNMSQEIALSEKSLFEVLSPKMTDLIRMIGQDQLKREASFAMQAINSNSYLAKADPKTVAKAIFNLALTGLSLNPISKLAYLTPRAAKDGRVEATLSPSYQGLVKLIADTGSVKNVYAYVVYDGDEFEEILGTSVEIKHSPKRKSKEMTYVYAVAELPDGTKLVEVMSKNEVYEIRSRSDAYRAYASGKTTSCVWITDEGEMSRKTVIKRITKYVPKTDRWIKVNEAINIDNSDFPASVHQQDYIYSLIGTSSYDEDTKGILADKVNGGITSDEASKMIDDLQANQLNPVTHGRNISATDAKNAVKEQLENEKQ